jgi:hypothetical protein
MIDIERRRKEGVWGCCHFVRGDVEFGKQG